MAILHSFSKHLAAGGMVVLAAPAAAQEWSVYQSPFGDTPFTNFGYVSTPIEDLRASVTAGVGVGYLLANEYVWDGSNPLSLLIWEVPAFPLATLSFETPLEDGWRIEGNAEIGMGRGNMVDYDWIAPFNTGFTLDDWSHQSIHPDTVLQHYISAGLRAGHDFAEVGGVRFGMHVEANYTDAQWTAYGGSFIYSVSGFRDTVGTFTDGEAGITYRQMLPQALAGLDVRTEAGPLKLKASAQGGVVIGGQANDDHWLRDLNFLDSFLYLPVLAAKGEVTYAFSDSFAASVTGSVKQVFSMRGDTTVTDTITSGQAVSYDSAGTDLFSASLSAGLQGTF